LNSTPLQFSVAGGNFQLLDKYGVEHRVYYSSQTTLEKWTNGTETLTRTKKTPTLMSQQWYFFSLDAPVGGGGGGTSG
jgi:hypothetical protein